MRKKKENTPEEPVIETMRPALIIFGLDPSEDVVGLTATFYATGAAPLVLFGHKIEASKHGGKGDADTCLFNRVLYVKQELTRLFRESYTDELAAQYPVTHAPLFAFESPQVINAAWGLRSSTRAVHHAIGAYVSLKCFEGLRKCRVGTMTAAAIYGGTGKPTEQKKQMAIGWANEHLKESLPAPLTEKDDAIADALVVAEVAWRTWANDQLVKRAKQSKK